MLISLVVFLQTYQMYLFHFLTGLEDSTTTLSTKSLLRPRGGKPKKEEDDRAFSACLMIMDDNAHLIEWLAYHYQALPLRRLIIAVDPRSETSPTEILNRWDGLMEITEWSDEDFMPPALISVHHKKTMTKDATTKLFRQRQEEFYARCMARLHHEQKTWVALIDTDEYILPNSNAHEPNRMFGYADTKQQATMDRTVIELLHEAQEHNQRHNEDVHKKLQETPCFPMARLSFGVQESETSEFQKSVPYGFDAAQFQTLRWRWHGGRTNKKVNKISKSIIDVSRVDPSLFVPTEQVMVHIPVKEYCDGGSMHHLWIPNVLSPLVVHHYAGTWEQWSHRKDTRGKRTRAAYEQLMYTKQADDSIRPWLENLIKNVGYWKTRDLLRQVGQV
jgi:hypothetical protein